MADRPRYRCIICGTEADDKPPRHCPRCGAPAGRWRLVVARPPVPPKPAETPKAA